jgi:hypothetical protein
VRTIGDCSKREEGDRSKYDRSTLYTLKMS